MCCGWLYQYSCLVVRISQMHHGLWILVLWLTIFTWRLLCQWILFFCLAGEKSSTRPANWHINCINYMLHSVYACSCSYCWFSTILWLEPWYPNFFSIFYLWDGMGSVRFAEAHYLLVRVHVSWILCFILHFTSDRYIITTGAVTALFASLLGSVLPQVHKRAFKIIYLAYLNLFI